MADGTIGGEAAVIPVIEFYKLIGPGRPPKRADRSAAGFLPSRALRYCDAMTSAAGFGYWLFPATDLELLWDGERVMWSHGDASAWLPLSDTPTGAVQFPGFAAAFDAAAPGSMTGCAIPFLTAGLEPGSVQMWTGLLARTRPGWSVSLRSPVNLPPLPGLTFWEGIIETDQWFGPLFTVLKITKTDTPVRLRADVPFLQAQPVAQAAYQDGSATDRVRSMDDMSALDWEALQAVVAPAGEVKQGAYSVRVRKRRTCPRHQVHVARAVAPI